MSNLKVEAATARSVTSVTVERIDLYECSRVPAGYRSGLSWRPAGSSPGGAAASAVTGRGSNAVERVLSAYEAHHRPQAASFD